MTRLSAIVVIVAACLGPARAAREEFRIVRLGTNAAVFQIGTESTTNVVVLASHRGLVVVDTGVLPSRGAALRAAIEREFNRKDFAYVVNTHAHFDHIDGNQAFADVPIVAQQNAVLEMTRWYGTPAAMGAFLQSRAGWQTELEGQIKTAAAGSRDQARIREQMAENAALIGDFRQRRFVLTRPTVLFTDRLTLDLGDLTLNLIYFGRDHTESDLLVHVPQLNLLLVGDLFFKQALPSFQSPRSEVSRWFQVLDSLATGRNAIERVVSGHDEMMTGDEFRVRTGYLRDLWEGVAAACREGATLAVTKERFPFETKYQALAGLVRTAQDREQHLGNITDAWRLQNESAARVLESSITARGWEAAAAEYRTTIAGNQRYNVVETELNALGYRYLQGGREPEAIAVFQINTEAFPQSWNVWDSLGEAYLETGDRKNSDRCYARSLELNPGNAGAKAILAETPEVLRFTPGEQTRLKGLYLGQTPPGATPKVFAPGVVSSYGHFDFSITFTPDGKELYFTRRKDGSLNMLMVSRLEKAGWTAPEEAAFAKGFPATEPHVTPDGGKLYFGTRRPRPGVEQAAYGIWVVERAANLAWGEPRHHGPGMYVSAARSGNLYMTDITGVAGGGLVVYLWADGRYGALRQVGGGVNNPRWTDHGFIAPDESYILLDSSDRPGGQGGEGDLYVCFRKPDGSWSDAFNLGDAINTPGLNFCPFVSRDGKYLFYTMNRDIYWVSAAILDELKVKALGGPSTAAKK
jgi:glyoxylase-like metal-dependent hydrolase (beta-lactamase superfamily II)